MTGNILGVTLHGTGPEPVLVLHDWLGDASTYAPMWPYLDIHRFTYALVDLRGYGRSMHLAGDYTIEEIAADCLAVADRLGWSRFHVVGHSMTGMATQRLAADVPSRIKSAVAVCPLSAAGNPLPDETAAFFASVCEDDDAFRRLIKHVTGLSDQWAEVKLRQNRSRVAPQCRPHYLHMMRTAHFVDEVRGLATPFLVMVGDRDPGLDAAAMERTFLAWHPNATLMVMPNCGHYPMQECPPRFAQMIENFLDSQAG
ncbi:alpha/beta fold hydrolase [Nitrospirillum amazonense]|uniref:Pimeloyl-ACP methyl ester carboxylesterase n=1 Tax=Nitrospirillum amazonense TaxID=28077 RepID=A0A560K7J7_9PROT|nr:alpha/beta hydrolase [Nitrospirillum amazonense]MDG3444220.1 alpha/beta hydrolase [Nitrospirillum amazonense]TWB77774.1 pimeloyl-ACP methyl ester carboxylesterase [Nitrospirillum amazonense]